MLSTRHMYRIKLIPDTSLCFYQRRGEALKEYADGRKRTTRWLVSQLINVSPTRLISRSRFQIKQTIRDKMSRSRPLMATLLCVTSRGLTSLNAHLYERFFDASIRGAMDVLKSLLLCSPKTEIATLHVKRSCLKSEEVWANVSSCMFFATVF